jgi:hypothetical protein
MPSQKLTAIARAIDSDTWIIATPEIEGSQDAVAREAAMSYFAVSSMMRMPKPGRRCWSKPCDRHHSRNKAAAP